MTSWLLTAFNFFAGRSQTGGIESQFHIPITVRAKGKSFTLNLDTRWDMAKVRCMVAAHLDLDARSEVRLILAGHVLGDDVVIAQCDLGRGSVLHAIQVEAQIRERKESLRPADGDQAGLPLNEALLDLQLSEEEKREEMALEDPGVRKKAHFYVYCSLEGHGMREGKLRVRCATCKDGAVLVEKDPCDWDDVLLRERIRGLCHNRDCSKSEREDEGVPVWIEFYFKCASDHETASENADDTPALYLVKSNIHDVPCLACMDTNSDPVVVFECEDRHVICIECFQSYCKSRLNERQYVLDDALGYTLPCAVGCEDSRIRETRHFKLLGDHDYERYQRFAAEEFVLQAGGVLCPQPDCGMGIMSENPCRRVACESKDCGYVFCRDCLQGFHIGECQPAGAETVEETPVGQNPQSFVQNASQARWVNADPSSLAIQLMTKPCPKCRVPTERSGGCMHMICTKGACGFHWCWICQTEWTRDCMASHWFG